MIAGKGDPDVWLGSLQLTPARVTCHTPWIVGCASRLPLHPTKVLSDHGESDQCYLRFVFHLFPFSDWASCLAVFCSSLLSCHFFAVQCPVIV